MFNSDEPSFNPHGFSTETRFLPGRGMAKMPKIFISREAYTLMALYVELGDQEVGWLGTAIRQEDGDFRIEKVYLFKQQVSGTETEISTEGLQELSMELLTRGAEGINDWNNMRFWGHSHVRMGTFASGTDENTMLKNRFGGGGRDRTFCFQDSDYPWAIRGIFNKLGRAQFSLFLYEEGLRLDDVAWEVDAPTASTPQPEPTPVVDLPALVAEAGLATGWSPSPMSTPSDANSLASANTVATPPPKKLGVAPNTVTASAVDGEESAPNAASAVVGESASNAASTVAGGNPSAAPASDGKSEVPEEEKRMPWLRRVFARPVRDRRYTPDITAELRRTVEAEFRAKVKSRFIFSSFRSSSTDEKDGKETGGNVNGGCIVDGEASGPGTTGNFAGATAGGGNTRPVRDPILCPSSSTIAKYGCNCSRCMSIRRDQNRVVAPGFFTPRPSQEDDSLRYAEPQESVLTSLGRFLADWFQS